MLPVLRVHVLPSPSQLTARCSQGRVGDIPAMRTARDTAAGRLPVRRRLFISDSVLWEAHILSTSISTLIPLLPLFPRFRSSDQCTEPLTPAWPYCVTAAGQQAVSQSHRWTCPFVRRPVKALIGKGVRNVRLSERPRGRLLTPPVRLTFAGCASDRVSALVGEPRT